MWVGGWGVQSASTHVPSGQFDDDDNGDPLEKIQVITVHPKGSVRSVGSHLISAEIFYLKQQTLSSGWRYRKSQMIVGYILWEV